MVQSTRERLQQDRQRRRGRFVRFCLLSIVFVAIVIGGWQWVTQPGFAFGSISIEGSAKIKQDEILRLVDAQEPINLFVISSKKVQTALENDIRFEKIETFYSWPGVLRVRVLERRPAAYVACAYNVYAEVDYNGVVMRIFDGIKDANAPIISGVVTGNLYFGDQVKNNTVLSILQFLSQLDREVIAKISEISVDNNNNVKLLLSCGYPVLLGNSEQLMDKLNLFVTVFNEIKTKNIKAEYINLTFTKPYIKLKQ